MEDSFLLIMFFAHLFFLYDILAPVFFYDIFVRSHSPPPVTRLGKGGRMLCLHVTHSKKCMQKNKIMMLQEKKWMRPKKRVIQTKKIKNMVLSDKREFKQTLLFLEKIVMQQKS